MKEHMTLAEELKQAQKELNAKFAALKESHEYLGYQAALKKVKEAEFNLEAEKQALLTRKFEQEKAKLISLGFECRTGHEVDASNHHDRTSDAGEPFTFVIVHKSRERINNIYEWSNGISVYWGQETKSRNEKWLLGCGETELEAWEEAIYYINDQEILAAALEGINDGQLA